MENTTHIISENGSLGDSCTTKNENMADKRADLSKLTPNGNLDLTNSQDCNIPSSNKTDGQVKPNHNNLHLPIVKDNNEIINRSFEKSRKFCDSSFEFQSNQEGIEENDSGVDIVRALSSNESSSTPIQSCGSSLVSYSSEPEADRGSECGSESSGKNRGRKGSDCGNQVSSNCWKPKKCYVKTERSRISSRKANNYEGEVMSESCSETSSTHEAVTPDQLSRSIDFKRSASNRLHEAKKCENGKSTVFRRSESSSRNEKIPTRSHSSARNSTSNSKVNSGTKSVSGSRNLKSSATGKYDVKGNNGKTEDSLWVSQTNGARRRVSSVADTSRRSTVSPMSSSMTSSFNGGNSKIGDAKSDALDKYGTLPRRPKKKTPDTLGPFVMNSSLSRSNSVSREPSLNRAATLRRQQSREKENSSSRKSLPPYPRPRRSTGKTVIYHEVSTQTIVTGKDISSSSTGVCINDKSPVSAVDKESKGIQTEGKEILKKMAETHAKQCEDLEELRKENEEMKLEKQNMLLKICKLLGYPESGEKGLSQNGFDELEQHFHAVGLAVKKQQEELLELRHYKLIAHRDLEKSLAAQKNLLQQQQEIEEEYSELQEFLQAEKTALSESLLDTEKELTRLRNEVAKKETLLEQQQEECKHLVRICEQRRQENLSLEARLAGLDQRSRDVLVQQGAAVSAAAVALSGLGARLDGLVEQLSISCNITEKDLEDVIYHNEVYNQSEDDSPDEPPSMIQKSECPKRSKSFLQVILGAIKNATQTPFASKNNSSRKPSDQNTETFFDSETEPSLNFDAVLEETSEATSNCTDHRNGSSLTVVEKNDKDEMSAVILDELDYGNDLSRSNSLQNLSEAILNRQLVEKNEAGHVSLDEIIPIEVNSLVDQIVDVDNLVTKLLKVIRIIQGESDRSMEELQEERVNLKSQLQQREMNLQNMENNFQKLQQELTEARSQLNLRIAQLEQVKALCGENQRVAVVEMQKRFAIIHSALGALHSAQHVVNQCPPLAKLRKDLEDCNVQKTPVSDVNANSSSNENGPLEDIRQNGAVLTTAI